MNSLKGTLAGGVFNRTDDFRSRAPDHAPPRRLERFRQQQPGGLCPEVEQETTEETETSIQHPASRITLSASGIPCLPHATRL
jgi:hypothetical protein